MITLIPLSEMLIVDIIIVKLPTLWRQSGCSIKDVLKVKNKSHQFPASNIINNFTLGLFPSSFSPRHTYFNTDVIKA